MGEQVYTISGRKPNGWTDYKIVFSEGDDDATCLCTFPHNNICEGKKIDAEEVRSLAYLGAMVALAHQGDLHQDYNIIPFDLPAWIRSEIDKAVKMDGTNVPS